MSQNALSDIQQRNARVEADKAWETSWVRRTCIAIMTYMIAAFYMRYVGLNNALLGAFVPTGGYLLSTLSLPLAKTYWLNNIYKKQD